MIHWRKVLSQRSPISAIHLALWASWGPLAQPIFPVVPRVDETVINFWAWNPWHWHRTRAVSRMMFFFV